MFFLLQPKQVTRKSVVEVEKDMMQKFMSPYERYTAYMEVKPLLEGGKRKKDTEAGDLERVSRVSQEPASLYLLLQCFLEVSCKIFYGFMFGKTFSNG